METLEKVALFWDVDRGALDENEHAEFVIRRVLARGDMDDVHWVFERYGKERVRAVFVKARDLDTRSINFWSIYFGVAHTPHVVS